MMDEVDAVKNFGKEFPTLERKMNIITAHTGITKEQQKKMRKRLEATKNRLQEKTVTEDVAEKEAAPENEIVETAESTEIAVADEDSESPMRGLKFKHLGRTSSFRIDTEDGLFGRAYYYDDYNNASKEEKKQMLYEEFLYIQNTDESDFEEMDKDEIELLIEEMKDYIENFNNIIEAYKEIEDFKKNQVEYFKEYIEDYDYDFNIPEEA